MKELVGGYSYLINRGIGDKVLFLKQMFQKGYHFQLHAREQSWYEAYNLAGFDVSFKIIYFDAYERTRLTSTEMTVKYNDQLVVVYTRKTVNAAKVNFFFYQEIFDPEKEYQFQFFGKLIG